MISTDPRTARVPPAHAVHHEGAWPPGGVGIAHDRRQQGSDALRFVKVAEPTACATDLGHAKALAHGHVRDAEGRLPSGASAFLGLRQHLPRRSRRAP
ncbi:MAG TPA: hypothetical protein VN329_05925 [Roseomonas sp.]|nr:hypothetical protein [Roseomonas sp.]